MSEIPSVSLSALHVRVYYAAKDGHAISLISLLSDRTAKEINEVLSQEVVEENGQRCTPLIVAARYGRDKVVKMILSRFKPNVEQEGTVNFDGYVIEGASALWCAAGAGHLNVVKILVNSGANVNHPTRTNSTPLRAACFDGRLDIVKYLTDHYADIHIANKYNNTCLMIAAYKGHLDVVSFLLENGANPDERAHCGATALHYAAECGHLTIVTELLYYGAKMSKNENGMTPVITAAERTREEVVNYFITANLLSLEDSIDALELLGASFANDKDNYCLDRAYVYLHEAMKLRYSNPENIIKKIPYDPIPAYENRIECQTIPEIELIRYNHNALHMESLCIRERILGAQNPEVPHPVIYRGAVFADNARFGRCIELWLHALDLRQRNKVSVVKDLLRFAQVFSQMIHVGVSLVFNHVVSVLSLCVFELKRNKERLVNPGPKDDKETTWTDTESNITTTLYILTILTKLMKEHQLRKLKMDPANLSSKCVDDDEDVMIVQKLVFTLNKMSLALRDGQTMLHLAVNAETPVDDFHTNDVCRFPCVETTKLLIHCGADVNAMDKRRNTPLHVIVTYQKPISDFVTLHSIILTLIENGAHIDVVNSHGLTPFLSCSTGVAEIILRTQMNINLMCLAAKAIKTNNIKYKGHIPASLEYFIELHGSGVKLD